MSRVHLFEFEDQPWFPGALRESITDFLSFTGRRNEGVYVDFAARLHRAMEACGERRLVDLCSGAGGPATSIARMLRDEHRYPVELLLTDLYPNPTQWQRLRDASPGDIEFAAEPVDAARISPEFSGFRLLCNGFHHFRPAQAQAILRDAVEQQRGIAIYEAFDPSLAGLVQPFVLCLMMLAKAPLIRPFRLSRLLFTYVLPAAPLFFLWDGVVSWMRIYSQAGLGELVASLDTYDWEIGRARIPGAPVRGIFLIGTPKRATAQGR